MDPKDKETVREAREKQFRDAAERRYRPTFITDPDKPEHPFDLNYAARDAHLQGLRIGYALALLDKPPVPTVPEPIPCSEQMPNVLQRVLVWTQHLNLPNPRVGMVTANHPEYKWFVEGNPSKLPTSAACVTHWQPLPPHPVNEPL